MHVDCKMNDVFGVFDKLPNMHRDTYVPRKVHVMCEARVHSWVDRHECQLPFYLLTASLHCHLYRE